MTLILQDAREAMNDQLPIRSAIALRTPTAPSATKLSGEIAYLWGEQGLPDGTIELELRGSAGQSLGAFLSRALSLF